MFIVMMDTKTCQVSQNKCPCETLRKLKQIFKLFFKPKPVLDKTSEETVPWEPVRHHILVCRAVRYELVQSYTCS